MTSRPISDLDAPHKTHQPAKSKLNLSAFLSGKPLPIHQVLSHALKGCMSEQSISSFPPKLGID